MSGPVAAPAGDRAVEELALRIASDAPELAELPPRELAAVARAVLAGKLTEELRAKVDIAGIDYAAERRAFLEGRASQATQEAYARALDELEAFARRRGRGCAAREGVCLLEARAENSRFDEHRASAT